MIESRIEIDGLEPPDLELEDWDGESNELNFLVTRFGNVKIEIFANEHPPPHFCLKTPDTSWNFDIEHCIPMHNQKSPPKKVYRKVAKWHAENRRYLIEVWNERRPSNCSVGKFRPKVP